ncbi:MAG: proline--tRNA ligase [Planctomycetales bacterium]|nr:proline--tRNA ligase [Planctomycetales bacterium]
MPEPRESEKAITKRAEDYGRWYTDVIAAAELADHSPVRGCMVIRPHGYAIWEAIQRALDRMIKKTGHQNAYFPLFIPESFLKKEAQHVEGFAPHCAVVTHGGGQKLEEALYVRPTSETIMYTMFAKWIQSWRDLPLLINQWANVVRWELRTRLFLRTCEFLWQEGHTAHATAEEADAEARKMCGVYRTFAEEFMALPVVSGSKSEAERFAGAETTYCIEGLMQDGKALQAGTSHFLGQNFAKAFDVKFQTQDGQLAHVWQTSWGVSTRLVGALIMAHSDDTGLVLPPKLAPIPVAIVPIWKGDEERKATLGAANDLAGKLEGAGVENVKVDDREGLRPGAKYFDWERRGVPLRVEIGPKDLAKSQVMLVRRDTGAKSPAPAAEGPARVRALLDEIQKGLFDRAKSHRDAHTFSTDRYDDFKKRIEEAPGFYALRWCGSGKCEAEIKEETQATLRVIPFDSKPDPGPCVKCGANAPGKRAYFARAY